MSVGHSPKDSRTLSDADPDAGATPTASLGDGTTASVNFFATCPIHSKPAGRGVLVSECLLSTSTASGKCSSHRADPVKFPQSFQWW